MCTPYHTRRCVRRFWGFARRYVKSQKEPERNLANVVLLFVVHVRSMMHVRNRANSYEIVRNRTNSHGIVRIRTKSYDFVRFRTNSHMHTYDAIVFSVQPPHASIPLRLRTSALTACAVVSYPGLGQ